VPYLAYARALALGRLVEDHLASHRLAPRLRAACCDGRRCTYVLKGLGVAWMPWSMVQRDCQDGRLALAGDRLDVHFDVRLYRPKRRLSPAAEQFWQSLQPA
jgi:DNA-binding transcriptional LysR family regulator